MWLYDSYSLKCNTTKQQIEKALHVVGVKRYQVNFYVTVIGCRDFASQGWTHTQRRNWPKYSPVRAVVVFLN